jgi:hypothetical protein
MKTEQSKKEDGSRTQLASMSEETEAKRFLTTRKEVNLQFGVLDVLCTLRTIK